MQSEQKRVWKDMHKVSLMYACLLEVSHDSQSQQYFYLQRFKPARTELLVNFPKTTAPKPPSLRTKFHVRHSDHQSCCLLGSLTLGYPSRQTTLLTRENPGFPALPCTSFPLACLWCWLLLGGRTPTKPLSVILLSRHCAVGYCN